MSDRFVGLFLVAMGIVLAALVYALISGSIEEEHRWEAFKALHHCRVTAHIDGSTMPTFGLTSSGKAAFGVATVPDKTGWTCDDGVTYYR